MASARGVSRTASARATERRTAVHGRPHDDWASLRCPSCASGSRRLRLGPGPWVVGVTCPHRFPVHEGIPVLLAETGEHWAGVPVADLPNHTQGAGPSLSVVIPALREPDNLAILLPQLRTSLEALDCTYEILLITGEPDPATDEVAALHRARVVRQARPGYGGAIVTGLSESTGDYVLTMDADLSHTPKFVRSLWDRRDEAELLIASRYVPGGSTNLPLGRKLLSRVLNAFFGRALGLRVRDMSSGFRLIRADMARQLTLRGRDFNVLQELLVRAYAQGWRVKEVPFLCAPRGAGTSHAQIGKLGVTYLKSFWPLWKERNALAAADYDDRSFDSPIYLQRYWQRRRCQHVIELVAGEGPVLDVGCGSSRILDSLPKGSVAVDTLLHKLRYARRYEVATVQASGLRLPFADGSWSCVLSSEVLQYVPKEAPLIDELCRVLRPGGRLVLGTPDYDSWEWRSLEKLYGWVALGGSASEHIALYTRTELVRGLEGRGFALEESRDILRGEVILAFRKPG